ncbi:hypothetical protein [Allosphingosinicella deserti]|nr:hypothetical protein [Sphingomonas deserti]
MRRAVSMVYTRDWRVRRPDGSSGELFNQREFNDRFQTCANV